MFSFHFKECFTEEMNSVKTQPRKPPKSIHSNNIPALTLNVSAASAAL